MYTIHNKSLRVSSCMAICGAVMLAATLCKSSEVHLVEVPQERFVEDGGGMMLKIHTVGLGCPSQHIN